MPLEKVCISNVQSKPILFSPYRFDMVNVHLKNRPEWFVAKSPHIGKVPIIEYQGRNSIALKMARKGPQKWPRNGILKKDIRPN